MLVTLRPISILHRHPPPPPRPPMSAAASSAPAAAASSSSSSSSPSDKNVRFAKQNRDHCLALHMQEQNRRRNALALIKKMQADEETEHKLQTEYIEMIRKTLNVTDVVSTAQLFADRSTPQTVEVKDPDKPHRRLIFFSSSPSFSSPMSSRDSSRGSSFSDYGSYPPAPVMMEQQKPPQ